MYLNQLPIFKELLPYGGEIDRSNRWIRLSGLVPWEDVEVAYRSCYDEKKQALVKPSRLILGLMLGQMLMDMSDREIVGYFHENPYFQYFCGQDTFVPKLDGKEICHPSLLSKKRGRLGKQFVDRFQSAVIALFREKGLIQGKTLMLDATVFPANITYPNDVKLLNTAREWLCETILQVKNTLDPKRKIRTYRRVAARVYRGYCKKKKKRKVVIRKTTKQMLRYVRRNMGQLDSLLQQLANERPDITHIGRGCVAAIQARLDVVATIVAQQHERVTTRGRSIPDRIVSVHQPQVRPIVRGKDGKAVEFGPKAHVALVDGYALLDHWDYSAYHEGNLLPNSLEHHRERFGRDPDVVCADQIYATRANRRVLEERDIGHNFSPLGRPSSDSDATRKERSVRRKRNKQRNHIEGAFGTVKNHHRLNRILWRRSTGTQMQIQFGLTALNLNSALARA